MLSILSARHAATGKWDAKRMVRKMIYGFLGVVLILILLLVVLSVVSRKQPVTGLVDGRLRSCPDTPNCVNSEEEGKPSYVEPLLFKTSPGNSWKIVKDAIQDMGGKIELENAGYLHATFMTAVFRFVDDVELRMDEKNAVIHVRSASRVGKSDMGLNRKRVDYLRAQFSQKQVKQAAHDRPITPAT